MPKPAPSCLAALSQATRQWPNRSRASDGIVPSAHHHAANPRSDHEVGLAGYNHAFDLTNDIASGCSCGRIAECLRQACRTGVEHRVKYIIWNRYICSPINKWAWRPYSGSNPHTKHMHVSVKDTRAACLDTSPWPGISVGSTVRMMCIGTHGAHVLPSWLSPTRGRFASGTVYKHVRGKVGKWLKFEIDGKQAWGHASKFNVA